MKSHSLVKKVLKNSFWSLISAVSSKASLLVVGLIVARLLGPEAFGRFGLIQTAIVLMGSVVAQAMSTAVSKHVSQNFQTDNLKVEKGLGLALLTVVSMSFLLLGVAFFYPKSFSKIVLGSTDEPYVVYWFVLVVVVTLFSSWIQGALIGVGRYRSLALSNVLGACLGIPMAFWLTSALGIVGALLSVSITHAVSILFSGIQLTRILLRNEIRLRFGNSSSESDALVHVGLPVLLTGLMAAGAMWLGARLLVTGADGFRALGLFSAASQWNAIFSHISVVLGTVLIPLLVKGERGNAAKLESINVVSGWIVVLLLAIPFVGFAGSLSRVYGSEYVGPEFDFVISCVALTAVLSAFKGGISRRMIADNVAWYSVASNLIWALMFVGLVMIFKDVGAVGMGVSLVLSQIVHFMITMPFFVKKGFVSKVLVTSWQSLLLWLIVPSIFLVVHYESSPYVKIFAVLSMALAVVVISRSLVQRCSKVS